jgi:hypothetical protein
MSVECTFDGYPMTGSWYANVHVHNWVSDAYSGCKPFHTRYVSYRLFFRGTCLRQLRANSYPIDLQANSKLPALSAEFS